MVGIYYLSFKPFKNWTAKVFKRKQVTRAFFKDFWVFPSHFEAFTWPRTISPAKDINRTFRLDQLPKIGV